METRSSRPARILDSPLSEKIELEEHIEVMLSSLSNDMDEWSSLTDRFSASILCSLFLDQYNEGFGSPRITQALSNGAWSRRSTSTRVTSTPDFFAAVLAPLGRMPSGDVGRVRGVRGRFAPQATWVASGLVESSHVQGVGAAEHGAAGDGGGFVFEGEAGEAFDEDAQGDFHVAASEVETRAALRRGRRRGSGLLPVRIELVRVGDERGVPVGAGDGEEDPGVRRISWSRKIVGALAESLGSTAIGVS